MTAQFIISYVFVSYIQITNIIIYYAIFDAKILIFFCATDNLYKEFTCY
jgi:hypothetical protein